MKASKYLLATAVLVMAFAFGNTDKGKHKEMRKEMRQYTDASIMPTIKAERLKFDSELTDEEKQAITEVRASLKNQKEEQKTFHKEMRALKEAGNEPSEEQKTQMRAFREQQKALFEKIRPIAQAHSEYLKNFHESLKPQAEVWKGELETIRKKYISDEEMEEMKEERKSKMEEHRKEMPEGAARPARGEHGKAHRGAHGKKDELHKLLNPVKFLLLDPTAKGRGNDMEGEEEMGVNVYPNPVAYISQIELELPKSGQVQIDLLDRQGNLVKTILNERKAKGKHTIEVSTADLPANIYYYKVITENGGETKKFIKQ